MFTVEHIFPFIVFSECCVVSLKRSERLNRITDMFTSCLRVHKSIPALQRQNAGATQSRETVTFTFQRE